MSLSCGLDFGTSNSTLAIAKDGRIALAPLEGEATAIPSAMFFPEEGEPPLYGRAAVESYAAHEPGRLMRALKSILSTDLIAERTPVGGRSQTFEAILVGFVRHLKARAEAFAGAPIDRVVMGRPVHFVDGDEAADARAEKKLGEIARAAGFRDVAFQFEPIAAALAFEHGAAKDELAFIADIGGGTADFSVVEVGPARSAKKSRAEDILANDGVRVGGTDFDMRLSMAAVMPHLGSRSKTLHGQELPRWPFVELATWHSIHRLALPKNRLMFRQILDDCAPPVLFSRFLAIVSKGAGHRLAGEVEKAKIALSSSDRVMIDLAGIAPIPPIDATRALFEAAIERELERLHLTASAALAASGRHADEVTALFLTGGASAAPAVSRLFRDLMPKARLAEGDLFNSVGFGLALDARRRFG